MTDTSDVAKIIMCEQTENIVNLTFHRFAPFCANFHFFGART